MGIPILQNPPSPRHHAPLTAAGDDAIKKDQRQRQRQREEDSICFCCCHGSKKNPNIHSYLELLNNVLLVCGAPLDVIFLGHGGDSVH